MIRSKCWRNTPCLVPVHEHILYRSSTSLGTQSVNFEKDDAPSLNYISASRAMRLGSLRYVRVARYLNLSAHVSKKKKSYQPKFSPASRLQVTGVSSLAGDYL